jgi:hypothetical protein
VAIHFIRAEIVQVNNGLLREIGARRCRRSLVPRARRCRQSLVPPQDFFVKVEAGVACCLLCQACETEHFGSQTCRWSQLFHGTGV